MARDKLSSPLTLPSLLTNPPASVILLLSSSLSGLWSSLKSCVLFPSVSTQRESPTLAIYILSLVTNAMHAVHPTFSGIFLSTSSLASPPLNSVFPLSRSSFWISFDMAATLFWPTRFCSCKSKATQTSVSAFSYSPFLKLSYSFKVLTYSRSQKVATSLPPCPSKTPNMPMQVSLSTSIRWASSCVLRQPYMLTAE